jgi:hypothetical protein
MTKKADSDAMSDVCDVCDGERGTDYMVAVHRETGEEFFICAMCFAAYRKAHPNDLACCECEGCRH